MDMKMTVEQLAHSMSLAYSNAAAEFHTDTVEDCNHTAAIHKALRRQITDGLSYLRDLEIDFRHACNGHGDPEALKTSQMIMNDIVRGVMDIQAARMLLTKSF